MHLRNELEEYGLPLQRNVCMIGAIIGGVAALGSAAISAGGAQSAANTQQQAEQLAAQTQLQMFNTTQKNLAPYMTTGTSALSQLASLFGLGPGGSGIPNTQALTSALENFPGYQFELGQGIKALDQSAASRGLTLSGAQLQATQEFGQQFAMANAWQPYLAQLSGLAGLGENAAAGLGNSSVQAGANIASAQAAAGQAAAAGQVGVANSLSSGLLQSSLLAQNALGSGGGSTGEFLSNSLDNALTGGMTALT